MNAFETLTKELIDEAILTIPGTVLRAAADKLEDGDFRKCISVDPISAYQMRGKLPDAKRAKILASSYRYAFVDDYGSDLPVLHEEIIQSIKEHPGEWFSAHGGDFGDMLDLLCYWVNLKLTPALLMRLLTEAPLESRGWISQFLARCM